ncbi:MAG: hypothetical protein U1F51_00415 [Burkholderiales bacterium]
MAPDASPRDRLTTGDAGGAITAGAVGDDVVVRRIIGPDMATPGGAYFSEDGHLPPPGRAADCVPILDGGAETRAAELLALGCRRVMLGEPALRDAATVSRVSDRCEPGRVGVRVRCVRAEVGWSMDCESNADFRFMRPTRCEPDWELVDAGGARTGTLVRWWLREMFDRGAADALIQVDIVDDADLNIAAGLVDDFGERLWFAPLTDRRPDLDACVRWGHVRRWAFPSAIVDADPALAARCDRTPAPKSPVAEDAA